MSGIASGNAPLTNLYHAYPNNINKDAILQRFSVAGLNSFETMYFNEFFSDKEKHQNIKFNTLDKGFTESGFELNKLLFGFGLSFTYPYGAYNLPEIGDNIALKFTFNITL